MPLVMGVFGIAEIMSNLTNSERRDLVSSKVSGLMPTKEDLKRSIAPILRGTFLGGLLGILPGGGAVLDTPGGEGRGRGGGGLRATLADLPEFDHAGIQVHRPTLN